MSMLFFTILFIGLGVWTFNLQSQPEFELKFSHKQHVEENELECATCHMNVEKSEIGNDNLMPNMEVCANCHDVENSDNCGTCHSNLDEPQAVPRVEKYSQKFSHVKHLQTDRECSNCHAEVTKKEVASPYILPKMVDCINCHETKIVSNVCESCHMAEDNLKPSSHKPNFIHAHSDLARNDMAEISNDMTCKTCHQPSYCQNCHEGDNLDRKTHTLNYQFTHALQAQGKERECAVCHTERSFCIDCHRDNQVLPHNHKAGWALANVGGRHRDEAKNDLESCMACHEQNAEQICQPCHGK